MSKTYLLRLEENDLGQILDGLEVRAESWERTAEYLRLGYLNGDYLVEECSKPEEADGIATHYRRLLHTIREQMEAQK
jgi:hypothetical protein